MSLPNLRRYIESQIFSFQGTCSNKLWERYQKVLALDGDPEVFIGLLRSVTVESQRITVEDVGNLVSAFFLTTGCPAHTAAYITAS